MASPSFPSFMPTIGYFIKQFILFHNRRHLVRALEVIKTTANEKAREKLISRALNNPGDFLLSHTVTRAVPSAPTGLTSVFGMGTGVTLSTKSPENLSWFEIEDLKPAIFDLCTLVFDFYRLLARDTKEEQRSKHKDLRSDQLKMTAALRQVRASANLLLE